MLHWSFNPPFFDLLMQSKILQKLLKERKEKSKYKKQSKLQLYLLLTAACEIFIFRYIFHQLTYFSKRRKKNILFISLFHTTFILRFLLKNSIKKKDYFFLFWYCYQAVVTTIGSITVTTTATSNSYCCCCCCNCRYSVDPVNRTRKNKKQKVIKKRKNMGESLSCQG